MNKILEGLKEYFKNTPREQVLKDWEECRKWNDVGPTAKDFIKMSKEIAEYSSAENLNKVMKIFNEAIYTIPSEDIIWVRDEGFSWHPVKKCDTFMRDNTIFTYWYYNGKRTGNWSKWDDYSLTDPNEN